MEGEALNILVGGEAGQGLVTIGQVLAKALVRSGHHIVVTQDYLSRIRGGHNTFRIRVAPGPIEAPREGLDLLVALDRETLALHERELNPGARVVADTGLTCDLAQCFNVPFGQMAKGVYTNTVALGVAAHLLGLDLEVVSQALADFLGKKKSEEVTSQNQAALEASFAYARDNAPPFKGLPPAADPRPRLMITGNEALALGALAGGVKFLAFYPMTPSTSVALTIIAHAQAMGVVAEQAEDEIAAVNMALGASYAGAPALVTTSGGGFALMGEGVSLSGMSETPLVLCVVMRPGPATGLPTRTEQGDLDLVLHAGHGEFPRAILAPGSVEQCFALMARAFHLAEESQGPVFVLSDQFLADSHRAVEPFDLAAVRAVRPGTADIGDPAAYARYAITDSGLSPRALPGFSPALVVADSDEHTEDGHITEDLTVRLAMQDKRLRKLAVLMGQVVPPAFEGPEDAELLLVGWGSGLGSLREATALLRGQGRRAAFCHFSQVWPLDPGQFLERFGRATRVVVVEGNATGQLARLIRRETGFEAHGLLTRYDGLPITPEYILARLQG